MQAPAHPDDETNALFALFAHGMGLRSIDLQNNRGEGGQNEIGPELFRDIGVLRTVRAAGGAPHRRRRAVLHARHRLRLLVRSRGSDRQVGPRGDRRRLRPADPHAPARRGRDDEHPGRAAAIARTRRRRCWCARRISAAGDPAKYPGADSRRAAAVAAEEAVLHRRRRRDRRGRRGGRRRRRLPPAPAAPPRTGSRRHAARRARQHRRRTTRCSAAPTRRSAPTRAAITSARASAALPALPGVSGGGRGGGGRRRRGDYQLMDTTHPRRRWTRTRRRSSTASTSAWPALAQYAGANPPAALTAGLAAIVEQAAARAEGVRRPATTPARRRRSKRAWRRVRALRAQLGSMGSARCGALRDRLPADDRRSATTGRGARGARPDVRRDRRRRAGDRRAAGRCRWWRSIAARTDVSVTGVDDRRLRRARRVHARRRRRRTRSSPAPSRCSVPKDAKLTEPYFHDNYWKHPANRAQSTSTRACRSACRSRRRRSARRSTSRPDSVEVTQDMPIQFRYVKDIYIGDKRMELNVVPAFSVRGDAARWR